MNSSTPTDRAIARSIKKFIESSSDSEQKCSIQEIIEHIHSIYPTLTIEKEDIYKFLNTFYVPSTVQRLQNLISEETAQKIIEIEDESEIKNVANFTHTVWDCSACHNNINEIQKIFFSGTPQNSNLFLSVTFHELYQQLDPSRLVQQNDDEFIPNIKKLIKWLLEDRQNMYSVAIEVEKNVSYVDNILLSYCSEHNCRLFTQDYFLAIRAKTRGITVKTNFTTTKLQKKQLQYIVNTDGKTLILDTQLFEHFNFAQIIEIANSQQAGKFLITTAVADYFELNQDRCRDFVHFLITDTNNSYSLYTEDLNDKELDLTQLATKYNGCILTPNIVTAFTCKAKNIDYYFVGNPLLIDENMHSNQTNYTASNTLSPTTSTQKSSSKKNNSSTATSKFNMLKSHTQKKEYLTSLPFFNAKTMQVNFKKLRKQTNISISVFDENGKLLNPSHNCINIKSGYIIMKTYRRIESGSEIFDFTVFCAVYSKNVIKGKIIYKETFTKQNVKTKIAKQYLNIASSACMILSM